MTGGKLFIILLLIAALIINVAISEVAPSATFWEIVTFTTNCKECNKQITMHSNHERLCPLCKEKKERQEWQEWQEVVKREEDPTERYSEGCTVSELCFGG